MEERAPEDFRPTEDCVERRAELVRQQCEKLVLGGTQALCLAAGSTFALQELVAFCEQLLQLPLDTLAFGDVPKNLRSANDLPCLVTNWRNGKRDVN